MSYSSLEWLKQALYFPIAEVIAVTPAMKCEVLPVKIMATEYITAMFEIKNYPARF